MNNVIFIFEFLLGDPRVHASISDDPVFSYSLKFSALSDFVEWTTYKNVNHAEMKDAIVA